MQLIRQSHKIIHITPDPLEKIEDAARTCYASKNKDTAFSDSGKFTASLIKRGHMAMLEFADVTVEFVTDRSTSHELVRHRLTSVGQQSQRYVKYGKDIKFILPPWISDDYLGEYDYHSENYQLLKNNPHNGTPDDLFIFHLFVAAETYNSLINNAKWPPERARKVLPNSTATTIRVKANFREWQHILNLRYHGTTGRPDPTMHDLMAPLNEELSEFFPTVFEKNKNKQK